MQRYSAMTVTTRTASSQQPSPTDSGAEVQAVPELLKAQLQLQLQSQLQLQDSPAAADPAAQQLKHPPLLQHPQPAATLPRGQLHIDPWVSLLLPSARLHSGWRRTHGRGQQLQLPLRLLHVLPAL